MINVQLVSLCTLLEIILSNPIFWPIEQIKRRNIEKLCVRYPEKFTEEAANKRELEAERKVLEDDNNIKR
jgi:hypothetical protein